MAKESARRERKPLEKTNAEQNRTEQVARAWQPGVARAPYTVLV